MNIRKRTKLATPVTVMPGDSIEVTYKEPGQAEVVFVEDQFNETMTFDEAAIVDGILEERRYIGGILIEEKSE